MSPPTPFFISISSNDSRYFTPDPVPATAVLDKDGLVYKFLQAFHLSTSYLSSEKTEGVTDEGVVRCFKVLSKLLAQKTLEEKLFKDESGKDLLQAMKNLLLCMKYNFEKKPILPRIQAIKDRMEYYSVRTLEGYLYAPREKHEIRYIEPDAGEIAKLRGLITPRITRFSTVNKILMQLAKATLSPDRGSDFTVFGAINNIVSSRETLGEVKYFEDRWGLSKLMREIVVKNDPAVERATLLPDRVQIYHFIHDMERILERPGLVAKENVGYMRQLMQAYYGSPHGLDRIYASDIEWLR